MKDMTPRKPIAIVGIGCRFPGGANSPSQYWNLLCNGLDAIKEVPPDRFDLDQFFDPDPAVPGRTYSRWGGFVDRIDAFDADFFGIAPREACRIDPQHRLLLEVVWEALEDNGQPADRLAGTNAGVFIGIASHDYSDMQILPWNRGRIDAHTNAGGAMCIAANRISYLLDLRGPSLAVDTACSSSLTAVHLACRSMAAGECDLAIAGGVNVLLRPELTIGFCKATMLSPDGRCHAFDARANGYVRGEGAGAVILKPLERAQEDGDAIYAVIRGSATNQDGRTTGISVPSAAQQEEMLRQVLREANVSACAIQYVEAHGTGTAVGDPIEAEALGKVFGNGRAPGEYCLIGSVKTNIGHLEAGAGIAGLIKAALALKHRKIPPSLHFSEPNPAIPFEPLHLRVPTILEPWPQIRGPAMAGVNSFGFGGANAHVLLEEPPAPAPSGDCETASGPAYVLACSARSPDALRELAGRHVRQLAADGSAVLRDYCYTAAVCRTHYEHRLGAVAGSREELIGLLEAFCSGQETSSVYVGRFTSKREPKLAFVFTGMGPQWWDMGAQLIREQEVFRVAVTKVDALLRPIAGWSLLEELAADEPASHVNDAYVAHVANFAIQVGLAALWRSWGIVPDAVIGHSSGEMGAACVSGALTVADAVRLAFHRGRLQQRTTGSGRMLAAGIPAGELRRFIIGFKDRVSIAAFNGPESITLSGEVTALEQIASRLAHEQRYYRFLPVEVPYHGPQMETIREDLLAALTDLRPRSTEIPLFSGVTGERVAGAELDRTYWWRNVREPVRFEAVIERLAEDGCDLFVEIGPHPVLASPIIESCAQRGRIPTVLPSLRRGQDELRTMLSTLAALHVNGRQVQWSNVYPSGARVPLPTYPWQRDRHWFDPEPPSDAALLYPAANGSEHPFLARRLRSPYIILETELRTERVSFLDEHVIQESAVFPAAGYVEMVLAAAQQFGHETVAVERFAFHRLLFLDRSKTILQLLYRQEQSTVEIHAGTHQDDQSWTLHASARLKPSSGMAGESDFTAVRERCVSEKGSAEFYTSLERRGLRYGPAFRGVRDLWMRDGEAFARIVLDRSLADTNPYCVHPALLDAAFQTLLAAGDAGPVPVSHGLLNLPTAIASVEYFGRPGGACWSHAVVSRHNPDGFEGDVTLFDDSGHVLLRCRGLRLRALAGASQRRNVEKWLYEEYWEEVPLRPSATFLRLPSPTAIAADVAKTVASSVLANALPADYATAGPALNRAAVDHISSALRKLGWAGDLEDCCDSELADRLGVDSRHRQFFARLLEILRAEASVLADHPTGRTNSAPDVAGVRAAYPDHDVEFELVERCGRGLAGILRGETDPRQLLFGDSLDALTWLYRTSPTARHCNELAAIAVAMAGQGHRAAAIPLRVLEIGAGTGGLTSAALSGLAGVPVDYLFTDVSTYFLRRAKEEFQNRSGVRFGVLDIESDPLAQGVVPGSFDVILGANVVHATADLRIVLGHLRSLLAPGGLLVLLELTRKLAWMDIIFGSLEGWWRFTDRDLRSTHPLLEPNRWQRLMSEVGFEDATVVADPIPEECALQSVFLAAAPSAPATEGPRRRWLILADRRGVGARVAAGIRKHGDSCICAYSGDRFARLAQDHYEIAPTRDDALRLLKTLEGEGPLHGVVHLQSLDVPHADSATAAEIVESQRLGCVSALHLVQAFSEAGSPPAGVWLVTSGSQAVERDPEAVAGLAQAPLWGFGRVMASERPELHPHLVDLGPGPAPEEIEALVTELSAGAPERETAFRGRRRWTRRLRRAVLSEALEDERRIRVSPDIGAFHLDFGTPGALDTLELRESLRLATPPGHVSIRVRAAGLNFRDVMLALGLLPAGLFGGGTDPGIECAGVVLDCGIGVQSLRPGDEVIALASGALGSHATARAELVALKPPNLSFEEAACIPTTHLTAHYGLIDLARMKAGDRVLIHCASGGIGHAALGLCQRAGAEIFATAGTPEKRAYVRSLGVSHVMDSRSLAWATEILERTCGEGVDIILNSLSGAAISKGLEILRPFGRFVEIGKRDIYADTEVGLLPFQKNLAFFSVDLLRLCAERPVETGDMLRNLVAQIATGDLPASPRTHFDVAQVEQAFRLMAQARHIGKVVLTVGKPDYEVRPQEKQSVFRPDATYLLVGGLGGFGLAVAQWMADQGARHLVLMSRSSVRKEDEGKLRRLKASAATVRVVEGDVSAEQDVVRTLAAIQAEMPPLRGVLHLAMVLDDAMLGQLDEERFRRVMQPKIAGAWNLHCLTSDLRLDHFILFSSLSTVIGNPGQGNYAAANSFLDALAAFRQARGLPAVSIGWGPVAEVGYLAHHEEIQQVLSRLGIGSLAPAEATSILGRILQHAPSYLLAARIDWNLLRKANRGFAILAEEQGHGGEAENDGEEDASEGSGVLARLRECAGSERASILEMHLLQRLSKVLAAAPGKTDPERPLTELGLDSLLAVELITAIKLDLGVPIPVVKLLQGVSTRDLVTLILGELRFDSKEESSSATHALAETGVPAADADAEFPSVPLSFEQQRFWFLEQATPGNPAQHAFMGARLLGRLDAAALARSLTEVVRRHAVLRAGFTATGGEPQQSVAPPMPIPLSKHDLRHLPTDERESELRRLAAVEIRKPFDLSRPPLLRALLVHLENNEHAVILVIHHICVDTWTITVIVREVMALYDACVRGLPAPLPLPSARYSDYVRRQQEALPEHVAANQLDYWKRQLEGASVLRLPTDRPPQPAETFRGGHVRFELSPHLSDALMELSRREGVTLFMMLLAAYKTLLFRYSGETDLCIGTAVSTRNSAGMEELVGCCMNTIILRTDLSGDPTFRELLGRVRETTLGAFSHQDLPFDRVVEALRPEREPNRTPLFQSMLVLHNLHRLELRMEGLVVEPLDFETGATPCDLTLLVDTGLVDAGEQVRGSLEFDADLFDAPTIVRMIDHFQKLLEAVVIRPEQRLSTLPLLTGAERRRILVEWNQTDAIFDQERRLHELFERRVEDQPNVVAVEFGARRITYGELDAQANQLANLLIERGVGPGIAVGLCAEPSPEMLVGLLGTLKAGGAYLPLDPSYPRERREFMLRDARAPVLLTLRRLLSAPTNNKTRVVILDEDQHDTDLVDLQKKRDVGVTADDLAYVIYTSGSTGDPKGIMISHRAISNQLHARQLAFALTPADVMLLRTPPGFDPSVWELIGPLCVGARLVVPASDAECDSSGLIRLIRHHRVTILQIVPSVLDALLEEPDVEFCGCLRHVLCGGEPMSSRLRDRFFDRLPGVELHNLYGPAEATIDTTFWTCGKERSATVIPIGRPLANVQVYILDGHQQPVPIGVTGELHIGGSGLARGYLNCPELTAEKFIPHPFDDTTGARLYRTGDLVRWLPDGTIAWLGRLDDQVKIRGCRVEPGEIAAALMRHPDVREAVVMDREDRRTGRRLIAYVASNEQGLSAATLQVYLAGRLPKYMVPSSFVIKNRLPRLPNGKVDRRALAALDQTFLEVRQTYVAPRDAVELQLVQLWEEYFDTRPIGVADNFFDLGGHSLMAMRLMSSIRKAFGRELPVSSLLRTGTVEDLGRLLRQDAEFGPRSPAVALQPNGSGRPFFCVHPASGSVLCYMELARSMGSDRPFYGLQAPALDGNEEFPMRIEDMAAEYLRAVESIQDEGPYFLGGWSMGSTVAYEMACRLKERGRRVALLALFDPPPAMMDWNGAETSPARLSQFAESVGIRPDQLVTEAKDFTQFGPDEQLSCILDQARRACLIPADLDLSQLRQRLHVHTVNMEALKRYRPRPFGERIILFEPSEGANSTDHFWEPLAGGNMVRYTMPGDHYSMLKRPAVEFLGQKLKSLLQIECRQVQTAPVSLLPSS